MTDALQRLRDEAVDWLASAEREIARLQERAGVYRHVLSRIDAAIEAVDQDETPTQEEVRRREKRDIRGAILSVLAAAQWGAAAKTLHEGVVATIGDLTDSAFARSLSSLVGDGSVIEVSGVFSLPATTAPAVSKLGIGFLSGEEAAK